MPGFRLLLKDFKSKNSSEIGHRGNGHILNVVKFELTQHIGIKVGGRKMHGNIEKEQKDDENIKQLIVKRSSSETINDAYRTE